ncbi:McbB family protein [Pseudomonas sp. SWRI50]|uniref:McbB family protein n=1 Tax=Pseudomonas sp. SWRI50 TaxID=2745484 RepID=UPI00164489BD|nr:McbB family protein [Pseudomonas sp. SWRI50]MBC3488458.1 McbB family protein [Pseudomonas sp. SWRI50]
MNTLRIYNYEILNFDTEPMVFSATGFTKITEPNITNALKRIEKIRSKYIHYDALQQLLRDENLHPDTAIQFLKSLLIISEKAETPHIKNTIIYHDLNISDNLRLHLEKTNERNIQLKDLPTNDLPHSDSPTLYVLACLKLCPQSLRNTYTELLKQNPECAISVGFVSGNHFHLTEPHIPAIGNPCAYCTLDRIAHYESKRTSQHYWSKILTFCCANNLDLPRTETDEFQNTLILGAIISFANKLTQAPKSKITQDQTLLSRTLNLDNGTYTEDCSIHWPLCQCLGDKP